MNTKPETMKVDAPERLPESKETVALMSVEGR